MRNKITDFHSCCGNSLQKLLINYSKEHKSKNNTFFFCSECKKEMIIRYISLDKKAIVFTHDRYVYIFINKDKNEIEPYAPIDVMISAKDLKSFYNNLFEKRLISGCALDLLRGIITKEEYVEKMITMPTGKKITIQDTKMIALTSIVQQKYSEENRIEILKEKAIIKLKEGL